MAGYFVSDIASLLGVSSQSIRNYEKRGLIRAGRTESKYRVFNASDLTTLLFIRKYRNLGFSIDEIESLMRASKSSLLEAFQGKSRELQSELEEIHWKLAQLHCLEAQLNSWDEHDIKIRFEVCDACRGILFRDNTSLINPAGSNSLLSSLIDRMPEVRLFLYIPRDIVFSASQTYSVGLTVPDTVSDDFICGQSMVSLRRCVCLTFAVLMTLTADDPAFSPNTFLQYTFDSAGIYRYMEERSLRLIDDIWGFSQLHSIRPGETSFLYKFYFPVFSEE